MIETRINHDANKMSMKLHHFPCRIVHDGYANVDHFVRPETRGDHLETSFRGRLLMGKETQLPEGSCGLVFEPDSRSDGENTLWHCVGSFDKIHYWNYDRIPSKADEASKWLDWAQLANAIHE